MLICLCVQRKYTLNSFKHLHRPSKTFAQYYIFTCEFLSMDFFVVHTMSDRGLCKLPLKLVFLLCARQKWLGELLFQEWVVRLMCISLYVLWKSIEPNCMNNLKRKIYARSGRLCWNADSRHTLKRRHSHGVAFQCRTQKRATCT